MCVFMYTLHIHLVSVFLVTSRRRCRCPSLSPNASLRATASRRRASKETQKVKISYLHVKYMDVYLFIVIYLYKLSDITS